MANEQLMAKLMGPTPEITGQDRRALQDLLSKMARDESWPSDLSLGAYRRGVYSLLHDMQDSSAAAWFWALYARGSGGPIKREAVFHGLKRLVLVASWDELAAKAFSLLTKDSRFAWALTGLESDFQKLLSAYTAARADYPSHLDLGDLSMFPESLRGQVQEAISKAPEPKKPDPPVNKRAKKRRAKKEEEAPEPDSVS